jgi:hypothetical protein
MSSVRAWLLIAVLLLATSTPPPRSHIPWLEWCRQMGGAQPSEAFEELFQEIANE